MTRLLPTRVLEVAVRQSYSGFAIANILRHVMFLVNIVSAGLGQLVSPYTEVVPGSLLHFPDDQTYQVF